jgi:cytochrome c
MNRNLVVCGVVVAAVVACNKKQDEPKAEPAAAAVETPKMVDKKVEPKPTEPPKPDPKLVERGAYIAKAGACLMCHTGMGPTGPDLEHMGAGGLEIPDPYGTWRTPNITPDKATGIGNWTDDQIARAIREGTRPDGQQLYAIMPYTNYNRLTDDDTKALVAFLRTLKPVERNVAPNKDLKFPKIPMPKPANAPDDVSSPVKHGEYLATVMLCSHCHWTPDAKMMPQPDKMFAGGLDMTIPMFGTGKLYARNITSDKDTGIGKWTEDQIYNAIRSMQKPDGKMINPPMMLLQGGWSQLEEKDVRAVATFIHQLPPVKNKVSDSTFKFTPPGPGAGAPPGVGTKPDDKNVPDGAKPNSKPDTKPEPAKKG